ncbi:AAA family ATPase [Castellaniella sp. MT123]|uniref:AAA family ATPase n=1 Tax=Castellaniella sp. MT123 TaxID=3140381 RepID=UPI0031F3A5F4
MKLTRIAKLRLRVFRDFAWPTELHPFAQFNVIYGWNGSGKTTLSWLLSLVEKKTALLEGEAALEIDGTTKVAGSAFGSAQLPQVRVFNRDFINATLSQTGGGIAPIYFLGEDSIEKQAQVEQLKKELATTDIKLRTAQADKTRAESKLDDVCKDKAKLIKELLTTANSQTYNNYDKRNFRRAVEAMDARRAVAATLTDEQKTQLHSQKNAQPKPLVEKVVAPSIELDALTNEVGTLVGRSVVAQTLEELTSNSRLAAWVQEGLHLHSGEHASDTESVQNFVGEA